MSKKLLAALMIGCIALGSVSAEARRHRRRHRHEPKVQAEKSLLERLGGKKTLEAVVDDFFKRCEQDPRVGPKFARFGKTQAQVSQKLAKTRSEVVDQLCSAAGGPCHYSGPPLSEARRVLAIDDETFVAAAESLSDALDAKKVPEREKDELFALVGALRTALVTGAAGGASSASASPQTPSPLAN